MLNQFPVENAQVQQDFFQISSQSISDKRNYTEIYSIQVPKQVTCCSMYIPWTTRLHIPLIHITIY